MKTFLSFATVLCCTTVTAATANQIATIAQNLNTGKLSIARSDWKAAISECQQGIEKLGSRYYQSGVVDDTEMKSTLAAVKYRAGEDRLSANLYCRTLAIRLGLFGQKTAVIPPSLVGVWASEKAVLKGPYLYEGQAIYLGSDGTGAFVVGPPPLGIRIEAVFNARTNTIEFEAIEKGQQNKRGSIKYNPRSKTIELTTFNGETVPRLPLRRRFDKFTDETRKNIGM